MAAPIPISGFSDLMTVMISQEYSDGELPSIYVLPYFFNRPILMYEVRYRTKGFGPSKNKAPLYLIKLKSEKSKEVGWFYKEIVKVGLDEGFYRIARTGGTFQDFLSKKLYRKDWRETPNKFFVNFPSRELSTTYPNETMDALKTIFKEEENET